MRRRRRSWTRLERYGHCASHCPRVASQLPPGLQRAVEQSLSAQPLRVWIVDNSESMLDADGSICVDDGGRTHIANATRWEEVSDAVLSAAALASSLGARTDFHILNRVGTMPKYLTVGCSSSDEELACGGGVSSPKSGDLRGDGSGEALSPSRSVCPQYSV